jgi:preprotein translocase subunit SecB
MAALIQDSPFQIQTQYVKDLSFENPVAPEVYVALARSQPEVNVNIDVTTRHLTERTFEVVLNLQVSAKVEDKTAFLVDLHYAVLIDVRKDVPEAEIEALLLREGPRFIFPFARGVVADVTREGGFPPLSINPIDFDRFYERNKQANGQGEPAGEAPPAEKAES